MVTTVCLLKNSKKHFYLYSATFLIKAIYLRYSMSFGVLSKEGQYQRMFKLPHNCTHFTC